MLKFLGHRLQVRPCRHFNARINTYACRPSEIFSRMKSQTLGSLSAVRTNVLIRRARRAFHQSPTRRGRRKASGRACAESAWPSSPADADNCPLRTSVSRCATPNLCCSSMITRPSLGRSKPAVSRACVPMNSDAECGVRSATAGVAMLDVGCWMLDVFRLPVCNSTFTPSGSNHF